MNEGEEIMWKIGEKGKTRERRKTRMGSRRREKGKEVKRPGESRGKRTK